MTHGDASNPLSVSELTLAIQQRLNSEFQSVWVSGEISNLARPRSGHLYLDLKDEGAVLKGVAWRSVASRLRFELEDGLEVICRGDIDVYPPRGNYQLIIREIVPQGIGSLQLAFKQLFERLSKEGLFDEQFNRPLPRFPKTIAFVTSPSGAAVRDFLEVIRRRWQDVRVFVIPAKVQGEGAAQEIVKGIRLANELTGDDRPEVLVVGRGGGSLEDLWCFNEEIVARAVRGSKIPTISAVGHEIDVALSDLAADVRALTPSEAAERVVPNVQEIRQLLVQTQGRLRDRLQATASGSRVKLEALANRQVLRSPIDRIHQLAQQVDQLEKRLDKAVEHRLTMHQKELGFLADRLESVSPLSILARGYSITTSADNGRPLQDVTNVSEGQVLKTKLFRGQFTSRVESITPPEAS